jgi:isopentenyl diphosphate isomerase/L-lactate dehydrogenase-like FMN-dependent dehydrogenase
MNRDRSASETLIKRIEAQGFKAVMLTVDAAVAGKRELDQRAKGDVGTAVSTTCLHRFVLSSTINITDFQAPAGGDKSGKGNLGVAHVSILETPWCRRQR